MLYELRCLYAQVPPALTAERQLLERDIAALYKKVAAGRNGHTQTQVQQLVLYCTVL
jgi:hypothetical protein